ncbi:hypothetical protein JS521_06940 [Streptomyces sp. RHZ10]|uniref:Uncharacterized protein n=1 Tax=Streptomyces durocortorensis TaxID=2811104 RepID=A0ABS2HVF5_9ACTN|nr:hypothetical protein [Streptomyces durocortorensis]
MTDPDKESVVIPVALVGGMAVTVVHIVQVVTVRDRHMPATLTVGMVVTGMLVMLSGLALVHVTFMLTVQMTVVRIIDVIVVRDRHVPTAFAVRMFVSGMRLVLQGCHHAVHLHILGPPPGGRRQQQKSHLLSTPANKAATKDTHGQSDHFDTWIR